MKRKLKFLLFIFFTTLSASAQECVLEKQLEDEGFENVKVIHLPSTTVISYENRLYRFEANALYHVLHIISRNSCQTINYSISIFNKGIPITELKSSKKDLDKLIKKEISFDNWIEKASLQFVSKQEKFNKNKSTSFGKIDIATGVKLDYLLGNFDNPIRLATFLQSRVETTLFQGLTLNSTYNTLVADDLYYNESSRFVSAYASYSRLLPKQIFARLSAGYFQNTQFGIEALFVKFFSRDKFRLEVNTSFTEDRFLQAPQSVRATGNSRFSYGIKTVYRHPKLLTEISAHYGKYTFDDTGYTLTLSRQFREVQIGFYLRDTDREIIGSFNKKYDKNYGFYFSTPIGFKKHMKPKKVRLRTQEKFGLEYNYTGGVVSGSRLNIQNNIINELQEYYPSTIIQGLRYYFNEK